MNVVVNAARRVAAALEKLVLPLGVYLGVTLAVPALNGAWQSAAFFGHAVEVIVTVVGFVAGLGAVLLLSGFRPAPGTLGGECSRETVPKRWV